MEKKEISIKDGMKLIGQPQEWGKRFGTDAAWGVSNAFSEELTNQARKKAWIQSGGSAFATDDIIKRYLSTNKNSDLTKSFISNFKRIRQEMESVV